MVGFADTSGLYTLLDEDDSNHYAGVAFWQKYYQQQTALITTNYCIIHAKISGF